MGEPRLKTDLGYSGSIANVPLRFDKGDAGANSECSLGVALGSQEVSSPGKTRGAALESSNEAKCRAVDLGAGVGLVSELASSSTATVGDSYSDAAINSDKASVCASCGTTVTPPEHIIVDCDTGVDDALALCLLVKADQRLAVRLLGVTCRWKRKCG